MTFMSKEHVLFRLSVKKIDAFVANINFQSCRDTFALVDLISSSEDITQYIP